MPYRRGFWRGRLGTLALAGALALPVAGAGPTPPPPPAGGAAAPAAPASATAWAGAVPISRNQLGVNVSGWDPWMLDASGVAAVRRLGVGMEQFPNDPWIYNWETNRSLNQGAWYPIPVSLPQWAAQLEASGTGGLFIVPYGFNPTGTHGATVADVQRLTETIVQHHWPVTAMVIGTEEYGGWALSENLHRDHSPTRYAELAVAMAAAIRRIDPAMKVGVDFDLPWDPSAPEAPDLAWDRAVLQIAAPHMNFLSVHSYPVHAVMSTPDLLQTVHARIREDMGFIRRLMAADEPKGAPRPQVWLTEFNPYTVQSVQSVGAAFGSAILESDLWWVAQGARQVDWWSLYGDAHQAEGPGGTNQNTPLASPGAATFATNGLASEGLAPQPQPENRLYPSGQAMATLSSLVGTGATLGIDSSLYRRYHLFAARLAGPGGVHWVLVNNSHRTLPVSLGPAAPSLAPGAWTVLAAPGGASPAVNGVAPLALPVMTGAVWNPLDHTVTISGRNLDPAPATVPAGGSGVDQSLVRVTDTSAGTQYGWYQPGGNRDWYGVDILQWTDTRVQLRLEGPMPSGGHTLSVRWWRPVGGALIPAGRVTAVTAPPGWWQPQAELTGATWDAASGLLTVSGSGLGSAPPAVAAAGGGVDQPVLALQDTTDGMQYGWAQAGVNTDWYGMIIRSWTEDRIVLQLPAPPPAGHALEVRWLPSGQVLPVSS